MNVGYEKEKINLSSDELDFLKKLSNELKTQDNLATRKPVVWRIQDEREKLVDVDGGDRTVLVLEDLYYCDDPDVYEKLKDDYYAVNPDDELWAKLKHSIAVYGLDASTDELEDILKGNWDWDIKGVRKEWEFVNHIYFLTRKAASDYINQHRHRFKNPRLFCDCSTDTPELKMLLSIVEKF